MSTSRTHDLIGSHAKRGDAIVECEHTWLDGQIHFAVKRWVGTDAELFQRSDWCSINLTTEGGTALTGSRIGGQIAYEGVDRPGALTFVPAGVDRHAWYWAADLRFVGLYFHPELGERLEEVDLARKLRPHVNTEEGLVEALLCSIGKDIEGGTPHGAAYMEHAVALIAERLLGLDTEPVSRENRNQRLSRRLLRRVTEFIDEHLDKDISLSDLAAIPLMPIDSFARAFRESTGIAPYQYVLQRRIRQAEVLLATTDMAIAVIALSTGFSSQSHLTTTFRRVTGLTPRAYRQSKRL